VTIRDGAAHGAHRDRFSRLDIVSISRTCGGRSIIRRWRLCAALASGFHRRSQAFLEVQTKDGEHVDALTRVLPGNASRGGVVAGALAALGLEALLPLGEAAKWKKQREQKLKRNQFGCVNVGGKCRGKDNNCCSGICNGKKPKKGERDKSTCAGHDAGVCQAGQDTCAGTVFPCPNSKSQFARCVTTTGNAPYCAGAMCSAGPARDADCPPEEFEAGAACILCGDCAETTACATLRNFGG
jgi:hypothetical protein